MRFTFQLSIALVELSLVLELSLFANHGSSFFTCMTDPLGGGYCHGGFDGHKTALIHPRKYADTTVCVGGLTVVIGQPLIRISNVRGALYLACSGCDGKTAPV